MKPEEFFSEIRWNAELSRFVCTLPLGDQYSPITLFLQSATKDDRSVLERAIRIFIDLGEKFDAISGVVADRFLPVYNESWSSGEVITKADFVDWLSLTYIQIEEDGAIELVFTSEDLFGDHQMNVTLDHSLAAAAMTGLH